MAGDLRGTAAHAAAPCRPWSGASRHGSPARSGASPTGRDFSPCASCRAPPGCCTRPPIASAGWATAWRTPRVVTDGAGLAWSCFAARARRGNPPRLRAHLRRDREGLDRRLCLVLGGPARSHESPLDRTDRGECPMTLRRSLLCTALLLAVVGALAAVALRPAGRVWRVEVPLAGSLRLSLNVPRWARLATSSWGIRLLDGRSLRTRWGTIRAAARDGGRTLALRCSDCTLRSQAIDRKASLRLEAELLVTRTDDRLAGRLTANGVALQFAGRLSGGGFQGDFTLGETPDARAIRPLRAGDPRATDGPDRRDRLRPGPCPPAGGRAGDHPRDPRLRGGGPGHRSLRLGCVRLPVRLGRRCDADLPGRRGDRGLGGAARSGAVAPLRRPRRRGCALP